MLDSQPRRLIVGQCIGTCGLQLAIGDAIVVLERQHDRLADHRIRPPAEAALHRQGTADIVESFRNTRENLDLAAIDEIVIDRSNRYQLRHIPIGGREYQTYCTIRSCEAVRCAVRDDHLDLATLAIVLGVVENQLPIQRACLDGPDDDNHIIERLTG